MKKLKKILIGAAALIVLLVVFVFIILTFYLGSIVKGALNTYGPEITGTEFTVESVSISIFTGQANIKKLVIGNPEGYKSEYAFKLDEFHVDIDLTSVFTDTIIIEKVLIDGAHINYEQDLTGCNLTDLKKNIENFSKKEDETAKEEAEKPAEEVAGEEEPAGEAKKFILTLFLFKNGKISVSTAASKSVGATLPMPEIKIEDLGKGEGGMNIGTLSLKIFTAVLSGIGDAVKGSALTIGDTIHDTLSETTDNVVDSIKSIFK